MSETKTPGAEGTTETPQVKDPAIEALQKQYDVLAGKFADLEAASKNVPGKALEAFKKENAELKGTVIKLQASVDTLMKTGDASKKVKPSIPADAFKVGEKQYRFKRAVAIIPGIGERTALEILTDDEAQEKLNGLTIKQWLVEKKSGLIEEIA